METVTKNVFIVGPQVSGPAFIGRRDWVEKLSCDLFERRCSVSLVGPTRIGKSSLVNAVLAENTHREDCMVVRLCMGEYAGAGLFWLGLLDELRENMEDAGIWTDRLDKMQNELETVQLQDPLWGAVFQRTLRGVFRQLRRENRRVVLVIDEFDGIVQVFGNSVADYQLLRSIYSESANYNTNGVIISRRNLKSLEKKVESLSTFHGVFARETLGPFDSKDLETYRQTLRDCGVTVTEDGWDQLLLYTGGNPYLCSIFGYQMAAKSGAREYDCRAVTDIYKECKAVIVDYYDDLITRLQEDRQLEPLLYLSLGSARPMVDGTDLETMQSIGVLRRDDCMGYYAYSADFMKYLRTRPLDVPHWELLVSAEAGLKRLVARICPELAVDYEKLRGAGGMLAKSQIDSRFTQLHLRWAEVELTCASLVIHKGCPTVLDAMTLAEVITVVLEDWDRNFCHHFHGDSTWKAKLQLIRKLYNPLASANSQYISREELTTCCHYCQELIQLV